MDIAFIRCDYPASDKMLLAQTPGLDFPHASSKLCCTYTFEGALFSRCLSSQIIRGLMLSVPSVTFAKSLSAKAVEATQ